MKVLDLRCKIIDQITKQHNITGGHCGVYLKDIEGELKDKKKELNKLYSEGIITVHDGVHGKMIKLNKQ